MHSSAQGCPLGRGQADDRNPKNIGADLAPDLAFATATGEPNLGRFYAQ